MFRPVVRLQKSLGNSSFGQITQNSRLFYSNLSNVKMNLPKPVKLSPFLYSPSARQTLNDVIRNFSTSTNSPNNTTEANNQNKPGEEETPEEKEKRRQREFHREQAHQYHTRKQAQAKKNRDSLYYFLALGFSCLGISYLAVPLYAAFCQMIGVGGIVQRDQQLNELNHFMRSTADVGDEPLRPVQIVFEATVHPGLEWSFAPCHRTINLRIGETALAFYRAKNNSDVPLTGVSTYNILPPQAGVYFNKIQCFCFDEQRLRAGEEMDMPVFFFLDPAMADDWRLDGVQQVTLAYTFFPTNDDDEESTADILALNRAMNNPTQVDPAELAALKRKIANNAKKETKVNNPMDMSTSSGDVCPPMPIAEHNPEKN